MHVWIHTQECVLLRQNVFSYYRMCSCTICTQAAFLSSLSEEARAALLASNPMGDSDRRAMLGGSLSVCVSVCLSVCLYVCVCGCVC